ncbi:MAG: bifunctional riboflavin kinase/FAD synthetase [Nitrospiraceae bacterium]|nr:bifunctional riboflavin kinase/FAD synthetase [Nitrospiraceae bacterium]
MKVTRGLAAYKRTPFPVLTIGNFDGQHRGHAALLQAVRQAAAADSGSPIALTFDPHPMTVLSPGTALRFLMTMEEKLDCFQEAGIDQVVFLEFNPAFAALTPEEFVLEILRDGLGTRKLFVGEHFAFGKRRAGTLDDLIRLGAQAGIDVHAVPAVRVDGEVVSSTKIRTLIQDGEVSRASRFLGRVYSLDGIVIPGAHRGQELGWPTANLRLPLDRVIPADGVYATTTVWNKRSYESVSYIGTRPTFGPNERLLEVYLLDERADLYGEQICVQFVERLREDRVFNTPEELSACIHLDVTLARKTLKGASQSRHT